MKALILSIASLSAVHADDFNTWVKASTNFIAGSQGESELPRHAHDPAEDLYIQALEMSFNFEAFGWLSGFTNISTFQVNSNEMDAEIEEAFLKASNLPYGLEFRGGRYLNRIGTQNSTHLHGWDFADANLSTIHFLGDEGLATEGIEASWFQEYDKGVIGLSVSYGKVVAHAHHEEEGHDEHEDEHHEDDEHDDDDHDEEEDEHEEEHHDEHGEEGWSDEVLSIRGLIRHNHTDQFQSQLGLNYVTSTTGSDRNLYGVDYTFTWRENGLEVGGDSFSAGIEYFNLDNGEENFGSAMLAAHYRFANGFGLHTRYEWLEFAEEHGDEEEFVSRERFSIAASYTHTFNEDWSGIARLQYNTDFFEGDSEDEVWLQIGFSYGGKAEVR